jgi:DNA-binding transcriptional regulator YhcF (GntR family)
MAEAFIKLYKKLLDWEWYGDTNTKVLFIHCLLKANWKATRWKGIDIQAGQFITSLPSLAKETRLSIQQVRTALQHLKSTGEITDKGNSKFRIITINNWSEYQAVNSQDNSQSTDNQQTINRQVTADKEYKNKKNKKINSFNNFRSRGYDYQALEKEVLNV